MCKKWLILIIILTAALPVYGETGCYSIVAGKNSTEDGSVLFGHNEDNARKFVAGMWKVERMAHSTGDWVRLQGGGRLPQVETTWEYLWLQMPERDYSDAFLNEHGVAIASNNCPSREDNPELTGGGIGGPVLRRLVAERARTAREGVELAGSLVEQFGYTASGRTLVICDSEEGWLVAMVNGKHWIAARVPDDKVALIANTYSIREVDLTDSANYLGSSDLIDYAESRGWYDPSDGPFDFEKAYANRKVRVSPGNTHRQWSGLRRLSAKPVALPEEKLLPFAVTPKEPLTVNHLAEVLRDHYEDTPYEQGSGYDNKPAHKRHTTTICAAATNSSSVFQLRSNLPVDIGAVWWLSMWQPCASVYVPIYLGIDSVPEQLGFGSFSRQYCVFCVVSPEFGAAYRVFSDLTEWVDEDYRARIPAVRDEFREMERISFELQRPFENYVLGLMKSQHVPTGNVLSRYCQGVVARAVQKAQLFMVEEVNVIGDGN